VDEIDYVPHEAQLPFHEDKAVRFRGLFGGTGSGKSLAGAYEALTWARDYPGSVGLIATPAFRKIREIVIPAIEDLLGMSVDASPFFVNYNRGEMSLDVYNGSKIWLLGLDRAEASEGMNLDWAWVDEARLIPKFGEAFDSVRRRLRGSGRVPGAPVGCWVTTTPDHPGSDLHGFFEGRDRDPESRVYRMSIDDNLGNLGASYVDGIKRSHSGGLYDRFVLGQFANVAGGAFEFDYAVHVQGYTELFDRENMRRWAYGVDFGWVSPSAILVLGFDGDGRAFVVDEVYGSGMSEQLIINEAVALKSEYGEGVFWCDSSEPKTIVALSRSGVTARHNKNKRDDGIRELGGRFKDAGDGRRRLYVSPSCVNLIDELQTYSPLLKVRDHAVDALRYAVMGAKGSGGRIEGYSVYRQRAYVR